VWLFDEAGARNQVDDVVVSSPSGCIEQVLAVFLVVALDILEIKLSLLAVALEMEDGT
jgi:hypothetical protein